MLSDRVRTWLAASLLMLGAVSAAAAGAQDTPPPTVKEVAERIGALAQDASLDEAQRVELTQRWRAVQGLVEAAEASRAQAAAWLAEEADAREVAAGRPSARPLRTLPPPPDESADLAELEEALAATQKLASEADARLAEIDARHGERSKRKPELAASLAEARTELAAARAAALAAKALDPPPEAPAAGAAEALAALQAAEQSARTAELEARVALLEADLTGFDVRGDALERRAKAYAALEQEATARRALLEQRIQAARELVARETADAAREAARAAERDEGGQHAVLQTITEQNAALSKRRSELLDATSRLQADLAAAQAQLEALEARMAATKRRDALARGTQSFGAILRRERDALPDLRRAEQHLDRTARDLTTHRLEEFDYLERQRALRLTSAALEAHANHAAEEARRRGEPQPEPLDDEAQRLGLELLDVQSTLLADTLDELIRTVALETELETVQGRLLAAAREFKAFIDERVLWVRSTEPLWRVELREIARSLSYLASPRNWTELPRALQAAVEVNLGQAVLYAAVVAALLAARRSLRRRDRAGDPSVRGVAIAPTFGALSRDALAAAFWPVVVGVPAWMVVDAGSDYAFARAFAGGMLRMVAPIAVLLFVRRLARSGGTGELHLGWGQANARLLRRVTVLGGQPYLLASFGAAILQASGRLEDSESLGRAFFVASMLVLLASLHVLLREGGLTVPPRYRDEESWAAKLRPLWRLLGGGGVVALLGLSVLGFDYTARQLHVPFERSLALMLVVLVVQAIAFRWLLLARRRILIEQARQRRESGEESKAPDGEELPDLRTLGVELRRAVRAAMAVLLVLGIYWTWRNEIPALGALDEIRIYPFRTPGEDEFVFTASKLLLVLLAIFATGAVARRLPGLLDFLLLDRTGMTGAERYAVRSVTQYVVVVIGVLIALAQVGITWSELQWLVAAISVGLGFGLQEIFANFVSGLILLFERPIRVGDLVTINGMEGRVTNIRIRATTILDGDRRELIVPNKSFVTGSLINWTLSDPVTRVTLPVGVAYGSDIEQVHGLLMQAAREVAVVLRDPAPHTVFKRFGDSALDFELRIFLGDRDHWLVAVNTIQARIAELFEQHGIEIPFPQRDVHIVSDVTRESADADPGAGVKHAGRTGRDAGPA